MEPPSSTANLSFASQAHSHLKAEPQSFVLLDAARSPSVLEWLNAEHLKFLNLYDGQTAANYNHVSPYLAQLDAHSLHTTRLLETSWGEAWGIYIFSDASLDELRRHFRRFLQVRMPEGHLAHFRFFDPRVLRDFLPAFSPDEKKEFFGPVRCLLLEAADRSILRFDL